MRFILPQMQATSISPDIAQFCVTTLASKWPILTLVHMWHVPAPHTHVTHPTWQASHRSEDTVTKKHNWEGWGPLSNMPLFAFLVSIYSCPFYFTGHDSHQQVWGFNWFLQTSVKYLWRFIRGRMHHCSRILDGLLGFMDCFLLYFSTKQWEGGRV